LGITQGGDSKLTKPSMQTISMEIHQYHLGWKRIEFKCQYNSAMVL